MYFYTNKLCLSPRKDLRTLVDRCRKGDRMFPLVVSLEMIQWPFIILSKDDPEKGNTAEELLSDHDSRKPS